MDAVKAILRCQRRAYWRRLTRPTNAAAKNALLLIVAAIAGFIKYIDLLRTAGSDLTRGRSSLMEILLLVLFAGWMFPLLEDAQLSITPAGLAQFPLSRRQLLLVRLGSLALSPIFALLLLASIAMLFTVAIHSINPLAGLWTVLTFFVFSICLGLWSRRALLLALIPVAAVAAWLAVSRQHWEEALPFLPGRLVTSAALGLHPWLGAITGAAAMLFSVAIAWWTFEQSLHAFAESTRRTVRRRGSLLRKELRYYRAVPDLWLCAGIALPFTAYLALNGSPEPDSVPIMLLVFAAISITVPFNAFGLDAPAGLDRYKLLPVSERAIVRGKNIAHAGLFTGCLVPVFAAAFVRFGIERGLICLMEFACLVLAAFIWGNLQSVSHAFRMKFYRFSSGGSVIHMISGLIFVVLPGAIAVILIRSGGGLVILKIAGLLVVYAGLYIPSLRRSDRLFSRNYERLRESLS